MPDHRFNIDCKSEEAVAPLIELVEQRSLLPQICVGSFSLKRLRTLRSRLGSGLLTSMAPSEIASLRLAGRLSGTHPRAAQVPTSTGRLTVVNERFISNARVPGCPSTCGPSMMRPRCTACLISASMVS